MLLVILILVLASCSNLHRPFHNFCKDLALRVAETNGTQVPADLALNCLTSVPLNVQQAKLLHGALRPYLKWQSTLPYIKKPPVGYQLPPYDFWAAYDTVGHKLCNSSYSGEYEFGLDLMETVARAHDGHFSFVPDIVGKSFEFRRGVALVSVARDAQSMPWVFVKDDLPLFALSDENSTIPSGVVAIDGEGVEAYMTKMMMVNQGQHFESQYNDLFWSSARQFGRDGSLNEGSFVTSFLKGQYPPDFANTTLEFQNGTVREYQNHARVLVDPAMFAQVDDARSFYDIFCTGKAIPRHPLNKTFSQPSGLAAPGYPKPIVEHSAGHFSGYFLGGNFRDVAVIRISSFCEPGEVEDHFEFQSKIAQFLFAAEDAGMTYLLLDLQTNPGGSAAVAYDAFQQLFPNLTAWGIDHVRTMETLKNMGQHILDLSESNETSLNVSTLYRATARSMFESRIIANISLPTFANWPDIFTTPPSLNKDYLMNLIGENLSMPSISGKEDITVGHIKDTLKIPLFRPANILMIHDGLCADMCATFSELLRHQARVQSVAVGGTPRQSSFAEPMPYIGQTKGPAALTFSDIWLATRFAIKSASQATLARWTVSAPEMLHLSPWPVLRGVGRGGGSVNVRDAMVPPGLVEASNDSAPVQFSVTPADCQMWLTPPMVLDPVVLWEQVLLAATGVDDDTGCAFGGIKLDY